MLRIFVCYYHINHIKATSQHNPYLPQIALSLFLLSQVQNWVKIMKMIKVVRFYTIISDLLKGCRSLFGYTNDRENFILLLYYYYILKMIKA